MDIHVHAICIVAFNIKWSRNISLLVHFLFNIIFSACIVKKKKKNKRYLPKSSKCRFILGSLTVKKDKI